MKIKILFLSISFLLFVGCSTNKTVNTPIKNTPKWIQNPNKTNHICALGSSSITTAKTTNMIATLKAKAKISKQIKIYIQTKKVSNKSDKNSSFHKYSTHQSTNMLRDIKVHNSYTNRSTNIYYIRMCSKITN